MKNTASPPGLDITPTDNTSINSGLTIESAADDYASLLGGSSFAIDPAVEYVYLLSDDVSLLDGKYLGESTATGHTIASEMKQATS